jgi:FixJ family two-component response regulator
MKDNESAAESLLVAIVDDDASMRNSTRRLIRSFGFRAEAFASAREFLDSRCLTDAACLVLDVRMPRMDGLELQRLLANANYRIALIFVTAHTRGVALQLPLFGIFSGLFWRGNRQRSNHFTASWSEKGQL